MGNQVQIPIVPNNRQTQIPVLGKVPNKKFWNFIKNAATENSEESVELRIEGDFVDSEDAWIYEWFGIPVASPNAFRNELAHYEGQNITVWIDSYGGSVFAAAGIYNALMEHKKSGAKVTTKADSKVMSAATIPYMAGDERLMSPMAIFMTHNPLTYASGYASDLRKVAEVLDTVKETIINAYQLGTGLDREKISSMMDDETYMSAKTAVKEGFATGILYSESGNGDNQDGIMNFSFSHMSIQNSMADSMEKIIEIVKITQSLGDQENDGQTKPTLPAASNAVPVVVISTQNQKNKEDQNMKIENAVDLKTQLPAVHDEIHNAALAAGKTDGAKEERERLKAFDVLNGKVDAAFLAEEKYKDGATAENVLFKAMQDGKVINAGYVSAAEVDATNANQVPGSTTDQSKPDEVTGVLNFVSKVVNKTLGRNEGGK